MEEFGKVLFPKKNADSENDHEHGYLDPHIWTSPKLVKIQAENIRKGLERVDPLHRAAYKKGYQRFVSELEALDAELHDIFSGSESVAFMVFHPSWGYFARTYGLEQVSIEVEGKAPKPAILKGLIQYAIERRIKLIFAQPEFSAKSAKVIAKAIGGEVVFVSPLAEDWMSNIKKVAAKFRAALR